MTFLIIPHFTQLTTPFLPTIRLKWGKTKIFKTIENQKNYQRIKQFKNIDV